MLALTEIQHDMAGSTQPTLLAIKLQVSDIHTQVSSLKSQISAIETQLSTLADQLSNVPVASPLPDKKRRDLSAFVEDENAVGEAAISIDNAVPNSIPVSI